MSLFDKRILLVTGKGGVGKSTLAASLAVLAAQQGRRVLLCETHASERIAPIFGKRALPYTLQQLHPNLHHLSIASDKALEEYVVGVVRVRALYKLVFRNRIMGPFMDAVPGLHELIQLGKVMDLERETKRGAPAWDLIIVDAPATGHGLTLLGAPASMMELTRTGPFYENAKLVRALWEDPKRTAVLLVTLPEEMPVNETIDLHERLGTMREQVALCVLNETQTSPASPEQWRQARPHLQAPALASALALADSHMGRISRQREARERLDAIACPKAEMPFLGHRDLGIEDLQKLASLLGSQLKGAL